MTTSCALSSVLVKHSMSCAALNFCTIGGSKYLAFHKVNVEFLLCIHSLAMSVSCNIISTTRWYRLVPPPPAEVRYAIETLHSCRSSVADDASIRLIEMPLAHPSTAESMLDARHSHCSHSNNLEHVCPLPQPVKQSRLYSFLMCLGYLA